jgi:hypothetical protein
VFLLISVIKLICLTLLKKLDGVQEETLPSEAAIFLREDEKMQPEMPRTFERKEYIYALLAIRT